MMENAASTYFGELFNSWLKEEEQDPLMTKVTIADQNIELTQTGENSKVSLPSTVDLMYIGEEEIPSITQVLTNLTKGNDSPAYSNLQTLAGQPMSFTITFPNSTIEASTYLYTVEETNTADKSAGQTGLIVACTFASFSLFVASLILLWAVGTFDGWIMCKNLRARFYMVSPKAGSATKSPNLPYGMTAKSTAEETEATPSYIGAEPMHDEESVQDQGIEMTPSRGIFREDSEELLSPADSQFTELTNFTEDPKGLGIASMRKVKRDASISFAESPTDAMSPEAILADIGALPIDVD